MDEYALGVLTNIGLFSFVALSAYLLLIAGELSFGQQAFFGVGAYAGGIATAMFGLPLPLGALIAMLLGAAAAALVGLPTLRLRGLYFAMATLAAAEMFRILFELIHWQFEVEGELVGPDGTQGFRGIRWVLERGVEPLGFLFLVWGLVAVVLLLFLMVERSKLGATLRALGGTPPSPARWGSTSFASSSASSRPRARSPRWAVRSSPITTPTSSRAISTSCSACTASRTR